MCKYLYLEQQPLGFLLFFLLYMHVELVLKILGLVTTEKLAERKKNRAFFLNDDINGALRPSFLVLFCNFLFLDAILQT